MLKNGVFWAEWVQVGAQVGCKSQMSEGSGQLKRADLRAFVGSVEGLYPLEGEVRNMGISEGFTAKIAWALFRGPCVGAELRWEV